MFIIINYSFAIIKQFHSISKSLIKDQIKIHNFNNTEHFYLTGQKNNVHIYDYLQQQIDSFVLKMIKSNQLSLIVNKLQSKEKGNLYLGGIGAYNPDIFLAASITCVITLLCPQKYQLFKIQSQLEVYNISQHKWINIQDQQDQDIVKHLPELIDFINKNLEKGNVLVHCQGGVSRSASVVIAFLMESFNWNLQESINYLKQKRPIINPNEGFLDQLKNWQQQRNKEAKQILERPKI